MTGHQLADDAAAELSTTPRVNRDPEIVTAKQSRLHEPHIAPITNLVEAIRTERHDPRVPYVDPISGRIDAQVLFLLETPARAAALAAQCCPPITTTGPLRTCGSTTGHLACAVTGVSPRPGRPGVGQGCPWSWGRPRPRSGAAGVDGLLLAVPYLPVGHGRRCEGVASPTRDEPAPSQAARFPACG